MQLSIIIPVYNCESYLKLGFNKLMPLYDAAIDFEIIYINDGSTDGSLKILEEIEKRNANVKVINQDNQGSSGARNTGIKIAKGAYIQFLDADDYINSNTVKACLQRCIVNKLDAVNYRMINVNEWGKKVGELPKHPLTYNKILTGSEALIQGYIPSTICSFLWRKEVLIKNRLFIYPKITHMDVEFTLRVLPYFKKILFIDEVGYYYLQRQGSITKPKTQQQKENYFYDEVIVSHLVTKNIAPIHSKKLNQVFKAWSNSIVWGLIFVFITNSKLTSKNFKKKCISDLKKQGLYPIIGPLKTRFQYFTRPFLNLEWVLNFLLKI